MTVGSGVLPGSANESQRGDSVGHDDPLDRPVGTTRSDTSTPPGPWTRLDTVVITLLGVVTAVIVGVRLGSTERLYFDEVHYVPDAWQVWKLGVPRERPAHPPLGTTLIGLPMSVLGSSPFIWRIIPAMCGVTLVATTYLSARLLLHRRLIAVFAAALVMLDGLVIAMSRIAMLDIVLAAFVMVAFTLVVADRCAFDSRPPDGGHPGFNRRTWAFVVLGGAIAVKWTGVLALGGLASLIVVWDIRRLVRSVDTDRTTWIRTVGGWALHIIVIPLSVYVASYSTWFVNYDETETASLRCDDPPCAAGIDERVAGWFDEQYSMIELQQNLIADHPYRSEAYTWPLAQRPVLQYVERCSDGATDCDIPPGTEARVVGVGNVALWWTALASIPLLALAGWWRRDWRPAAILVPAVTMWAPWLFSINPGFMFYMTPIVPFYGLTVAYVVGTVLPTRWSRPAMGLVLAAALAVFVFLYPIWTGLPLGGDGIDTRLLFHSWR